MWQTIPNLWQENGTLSVIFTKKNYDVGTETIHNIEVLKSSLCDYKNAYILVRGDITGRAAPAIQVAF